MFGLPCFLRFRSFALARWLPDMGQVDGNGVATVFVFVVVAVVDTRAQHVGFGCDLRSTEIARFLVNNIMVVLNLKF